MIRYAKKSMTIDGIIFNQGEIIPESLYPAADAADAALEKQAEQEAISNSSFPSDVTEDIDEDAEDMEEDEDEETFQVAIPEGGTALDAAVVDAALPTPDVDSTTPDVAAEVPKTSAKKSGK